MRSIIEMLSADLPPGAGEWTIHIIPGGKKDDHSAACCDYSRWKRTMGEK